MVRSNPFFHRGPIHDPAYFFGRKAELVLLFDMLRQGQSVSISGHRRLGKSSLLFCCQNFDVAARHGLDTAQIRFVYLDGGMLDGHDADWLYGSIDRELGGQEDAIPYSEFVRRLRDVASQDQRLILLIDEFEMVAANPRYDKAVFNRLRSLPDHYPIQFVTASKERLARLPFANPDTISSPFFNNFFPLQLALFPRDEAVELLTALSERGESPFAPDTVDALYGMAGGHPLFLQVAGSRAFAAQADGPLTSSVMDALRDQTGADLQDHLGYYWDGLTSDEQYALATLGLTAADGDVILQRLAELSLIEGLAYAGEILRDFVRRQPVEGVLRAGPVLVDLRRRAASADGIPIHLTRTQFATLIFLIEHKGDVVTPEEIEAAVRPGEFELDPERARGFMKTLRKALHPHEDLIVNVRGQGYRLEM